MDIELLSGLLKTLLLEKDEVGLPGLGTFVCEVVPASFSDRGYTINPPYRRVSFSQASSQDTSLVDCYAAASSLDARTARNMVQKFLSDLAAQLRREKSIALPGLGKLRATRDNSFFFVSDADLDIFPDGFGLAPVSMRQRTSAPLLADILAEDGPLAPEIPAPAAEVLELSEGIIPTGESAEPQAAAIEAASEAAAEAPTPTDAELEANLRKRRARVLWWIIPLALVLLAALAYLAFMLLAMYRPDILDLILYTPEELEIINYVL
ncbi:MAG: hypothetical protein KBS55_02900 [Bacteroidales bacterium]|nr:hypothetical protein [Candidatus Cryptobacteroides aphodequi]